MPEIRDHLFGLVRDSPAQQARAKALWTSIERRQKQIERTLARYREGGLPAAQAAINQDVIASSTAIRRQAAALNNAERELLAQRGQSTHDSAKLTNNLFATLFPDMGGCLYFLRNSQDHAELAAQWGDAAPVPAGMIAVDACWALRRGQPHAADPRRGTRCTHCTDWGGQGAEEASDLCLPLVAQGAQLGLPSLSGSEQILSAHRDIIEAASEKLSMALANLSLQDRLRQQSIRDPLTGLFNRRYLEESATRELTRCVRRGLPLSLLMFDIDHFKSFNDVHGHAGGDAVLAGFGKLLHALYRAKRAGRNRVDIAVGN